MQKKKETEALEMEGIDPDVRWPSLPCPTPPTRTKTDTEHTHPHHTRARTHAPTCTHSIQIAAMMGFGGFGGGAKN